MGKNTTIKWADHTFNPWYGCTKVSPGCNHCYAENWAKRAGSAAHSVKWGSGEARYKTSINTWLQPRLWNQKAKVSGVRSRVFCASLADVFDTEIPHEWREDLWAIIHATPNLDWLIVTKRIGNAARLLPDNWGNGWPNVWLLSTVCNQTEADRDIPRLLATQARVRGVSIEPILGDISLVSLERGNGYWLNALTGKTRIYHDGGMPFDEDLPGLDWVIVGGESGAKARPINPAWVRSLRDQCNTCGIPFFFKQWGEWATAEQHGLATSGVRSRLLEDAGKEWVEKVGKKCAGRMLDGQEWNEPP